jgi:HD-GYP domain-containing protein (c-di-GMP phosphodiesterase class II)
MTSDRPYRKGMPAEAAFDQVRKGAGSQFDPVFAQAFLAIKDDIVRQMETMVKAPSKTKTARVQLAECV